MILLETRSLVKSFGGLRAVKGLDMRVEAGRIFSVIGPNGAGKTTIFNCLMGFYQPDEGALFFNGREMKRLQPHQAARLGIARTFQNVRLFGELDALENVMVGRFCRTRSGVLGSFLRLPGARREERGAADRARELLRFVGLEPETRTWARNLPYGKQRRLEIARALATDPKLLLLDEPAAGMNPTEIAQIMALIRKIRASGITVLLIEHHMQVVMNISDRILVLDHGEKIAEGPPSAVQNDPKVIEAYLGKEQG